MMPRRRASLSGAQRRTLGRLADELIPRSDAMPSATDVNIGGELIDLVLGSRDDLAKDLERLLDDAEHENPTATLRRLASGDRNGLHMLRLVVAGGYLMSPRVGRLIGYAGQQPKQVDPYSYVALVDSGLLDPVVARGPIFRPTPNQSETT